MSAAEGRVETKLRRLMESGFSGFANYEVEFLFDRLDQERSRAARITEIATELLDKMNLCDCSPDIVALQVMLREAITPAVHPPVASAPPTAALSRAMGGGDDLMQTIVDICRPVRS